MQQLNLKTMTKKDYEKIAGCLRNFYKKWEQVLETQPQDGFDDVQFLIDEFCYMLEEDNEKFDEKRFRRLILGIK